MCSGAVCRKNNSKDSKKDIWNTSQCDWSDPSSISSACFHLYVHLLSDLSGQILWIGITPVQKTVEQLCQWPNVNRDCILKVVSRKWAKYSFLVNYPFNKLTTLLWRYEFPFSLPPHVLIWVSVNRKWECPIRFIEAGLWNVPHFSDFCVRLDWIICQRPQNCSYMKMCVGGAKRTSWMCSAWSDFDLR